MTTKKNVTRQRLLLLFCSLFGVIILAEIVVRAIGRTDQAGNFVFNNRVIRPHRLPIATASAQIARLQASQDEVVIAHPVLGWVNRPNCTSGNGLYHYNSQGLRSAPREYTALPDSGVLRIALFGDSFTHGNDVPYEHTFGGLLEARLESAGIKAEVMNYGVGGYGIDQAMLRFHEYAMDAGAHLAVLGFQAENLKRNMNILRPLYDPRTSLPFAKPRFVLTEDGLGMLNMPVMPVEQVVPTLLNLDNWQLAPYEYFYTTDDYESTWWRSSRLLATAADLLFGGDDEWLLKRILYGKAEEEYALGWAVIKAFAADVNETGATFMIVHLPTQQDMGVYSQLGRWMYQRFLDALAQQYLLVNPDQVLMQAGAESGFRNLFAGHYTLLGNQIVADALFEHIAGQHKKLLEQVIKPAPAEE